MSVPTADRLVGADGDEPGAVWRISELRDSATVCDVVAQRLAVTKAKHLNVPEATLAEISEG